MKRRISPSTKLSWDQFEDLAKLVGFDLANLSEEEQEIRYKTMAAGIDSKAAAEYIKLLQKNKKRAKSRKKTKDGELEALKSKLAQWEQEKYSSRANLLLWSALLMPNNTEDLAFKVRLTILAALMVGGAVLAVELYKRLASMKEKLFKRKAEKGPAIPPDHGRGATSPEARKEHRRNH